MLRDDFLLEEWFEKKFTNSLALSKIFYLIVIKFLFHLFKGGEL